MFYPGEQSAFPVVVLYLDDVIHDEPGPDVEISDTRGGLSAMKTNHLIKSKVNDVISGVEGLSSSHL